MEVILVILVILVDLVAKYIIYSIGNKNIPQKRREEIRVDAGQDISRKPSNKRLPQKRSSKEIFTKILEKVKDFLTPNVSGEIVYESPSSMPLNSEEIVTVRISKKSLREEILQKGLKKAKVKEAGLEISDVMMVALFEVSEKENFKIKSINNPIQRLNKKKYTEWKFNIIPQRVGKHSIVLRVSMLIYVRKIGVVKQDLITWNSQIEIELGAPNTFQKVKLKHISWDEKFKLGLKKKIAEDKLDEVFENLANHLASTNKELFNDFVILKSRFTKTKKSQQLGIMSYSEFSLDSIQVAHSLLRLIDEVGSPKDEKTNEEYKKVVDRMKNL